VSDNETGGKRKTWKVRDFLVDEDEAKITDDHLCPVQQWEELRAGENEVKEKATGRGMHREEGRGNRKSSRVGTKAGVERAKVSTRNSDAQTK